MKKKEKKTRTRTKRLTKGRKRDIQKKKSQRKERASRRTNSEGVRDKAWNKRK